MTNQPHDDSRITVAASIPDIQSAATFSGDVNGGVRLKLDIPAQDYAHIARLMLLAQGKPMRVTFEILPALPQPVAKSKKDEDIDPASAVANS